MIDALRPWLPESSGTLESYPVTVRDLRQSFSSQTQTPGDKTPTQIYLQAADTTRKRYRMVSIALLTLLIVNFGVLALALTGRFSTMEANNPEPSNPNQRNVPIKTVEEPATITALPVQIFDTAANDATILYEMVVTPSHLPFEATIRHADEPRPEHKYDIRFSRLNGQLPDGWNVWPNSRGS